MFALIAISDFHCGSLAPVASKSDLSHVTRPVTPVARTPATTTT